MTQYVPRVADRVDFYVDLTVLSDMARAVDDKFSITCQNDMLSRFQRDLSFVHFYILIRNIPLPRLASK